MYCLQCYRTSSPILANYSLAGQILECIKEHSYLGIILDQQMTFTSHINYIVSKAAKVLNFLKRNLHKCSTSSKAIYISLVRPTLEYASFVWDPYQYNKIYIIDRIQHRAARWSLCNYDRYSSVTLMQHQLSWQNLQGSSVASLDLMLGHTFYNRPCLATGMLVHTCIYMLNKNTRVQKRQGQSKQQLSDYKYTHSYMRLKTLISR